MKTSPLRLSPKILCLPVVHGSADCAHAVRRRMLEGNFDCLAVALPHLFAQVCSRRFNYCLLIVSSATVFAGFWIAVDESDVDEDENEDTQAAWSYVPIDPCQPVISGLRIAVEERMAIQFIDLETNAFQPHLRLCPTPTRYARYRSKNLQRPFFLASHAHLLLSTSNVSSTWHGNCAS